MFYTRLTADERQQKLTALNEEQRSYLINYLKRGKRTAFDNFMQDEKVTAIRSADEITLSEEELQTGDWAIVEFVDFGEHNRGGKCACGRALRYEFTVEHAVTKKRISYGKEHLSQFLNIEVRDVDALLGTIEAFDHELDEILDKIEREDTGYELYEQLLNKEEVPDNIINHMELALPLLDYQRRKLTKMAHLQLEEKLLAVRIAEGERDAEIIAEARKYAALQKQLQEKEQQEQARRLAILQQQREEQDAVYVEIFENTVRTLSPEESELEHIAYALVENGVHSAIEISRLIMQNFSKEKRISMGEKRRPYIYFDVLVALDRQVSRGKLVKDDASSIHDCIYYIDETEEHSTAMESFQQTLF